MLRRFAKFAVVVTVSTPAFSKAIDDAQVARWARAGGVSFLIGAAWTEGEAQARGVVVSDADAREAMEPPHDGLTRDDRIYEAKIVLLNAGLHGPVSQAAAESVTQPEIDAYVIAHPKFAPEERSVALIQTRDRNTAEATLKRLKRGATLEGAAPGHVRRLTVHPGELDPAGLDRAIFKAPTGAYVRYGTAVFRVRSVGEPKPLNLKQQNASAWEVLASEAQERAIAAFDAETAAKWRPSTICAPQVQNATYCSSSPMVE